MVSELELEIYQRYKEWAQETSRLQKELEAIPPWKQWFYFWQYQAACKKMLTADRSMRFYASLIKEFHLLSKIHKTPEALLQQYLLKRKLRNQARSPRAQASDTTKPKPPKLTLIDDQEDPNL